MSDQSAIISDETLVNNFHKVQKQLAQANASTNRATPATLLAVSKTKPEQMIRTLFAQGQRDFGENYLQEARAKQDNLADLDIVWHYIGSIQRNKTKDIANHFDWVHTIDRAIIAERLNAQRTVSKPLNVLIQINIDDENSKSGVSADGVLALVDEIKGLPNLCLRGLMVIPAKASKDAFYRTKQIFDDVAQAYALPQ